ncbi:glutamate decarboxylase [Eremomyces bilateralis CBS 781.70]|uniref:Glutamate decarboxylase n=1 Tax=Eremomyces bilateralis CBS 781.70 TaxID=1392243 RepID=A0A6G1FSS4_9PEZI|nr:glutamate decarboxylase [Eremomyces bilateralis CBS 781.70]KAF1808837.1 glutamate decarboxylase [Eremomyces bilateralis CBS 781.70]
MKIDPEELVELLRDSPRGKHAKSHVSHFAPYTARDGRSIELSKFRLPTNGGDPSDVRQILDDELSLDGRPALNLASFVSTYLEPEAERLLKDNYNKNLADSDEYPTLMDIHARCVSILANLWHVQPGERAIGTATTGSSEAIQLGGLAMKRRWKEKREAEGKDTSKPNIIMGANAQVALEKFARYFEVEARILPVSKESHHRLDERLVKENVDENTIGVYIILGSTYTGHFEPVQTIAELLDEVQKEKGLDVPIHVDAASGGLVAPFTDAGVGGGAWDFKIRRVHSINVSGHKYGLVSPGLGWIIFRDQHYLPRHLVFELNYLGGKEESYTLNFSRPGGQVVVQYFNFMRLGFTGYKRIMENCLAVARLLSRSLEATGWYRCLSDVHRKKGDWGYHGQKEFVRSESSADYNEGLPVVAFAFTEQFKKEYPHVKQAAVSQLLRARQYIVPNYPLPANEQNTEILRVVVRESVSMDLIDRLIGDLVSVTETVMQISEGDLAAWQSLSADSVEKMHSTKKRKRSVEEDRKQGKMAIHTAVC